MKKGTKTIAQQINWDFKTNDELRIKDNNGKLIYWEDSNRVWEKSEYDSQGRLIYRENSNGFWVKNEWDSQGNQIYFENSNGGWGKWEYDSQGKEIYRETSNGKIVDNRPKTCENKVIEIDGEKFKLVKV